MSQQNNVKQDLNRMMKESKDCSFVVKMRSIYITIFFHKFVFYSYFATFQ